MAKTNAKDTQVVKSRKRGPNGQWAMRSSANGQFIVLRLSPSQSESKGKFLDSASLKAVDKKGGQLTRKEAARSVKKFIDNKKNVGLIATKRILSTACGETNQLSRRLH